MGYSKSDERELDEKFRLIAELADDKTALCANIDSSDSENKKILNNFGIKPGWSEIKYGENPINFI
ncbi:MULTISPECIES: hypothetical protein [Clostridium]|uniref:Uncharacterized protein n=1 Tax=Clostridium lapidicellarium TaxID=3240931 RepID=A0ABV4DZA5_9CLOT|nr:hypothetical protein [uncultured Clostridium sp.]